MPSNQDKPLNEQKRNELFIDNVDVERLSGDIKIIKDDKVELEKISNTLTEEFTKHLDKIMQDLYVKLKKRNVDDKELEHAFLELTNVLYFLGDKLESLGIELTVSSSRNQEIFNRLYQEAQGTINDKKASAEEGTKYEYLLKTIYESVYKRIRMKIDAGYEMVSSLKRIIMLRSQEIGLTNKANAYGNGGGQNRRSAFEGDD